MTAQMYCGGRVESGKHALGRDAGEPPGRDDGAAHPGGPDVVDRGPDRPEPGPEADRLEVVGGREERPPGGHAVLDALVDERGLEHHRDQHQPVHVQGAAGGDVRQQVRLAAADRDAEVDRLRAQHRHHAREGEWEGIRYLMDFSGGKLSFRADPYGLSVRHARLLPVPATTATVPNRAQRIRAGHRWVGRSVVLRGAGARSGISGEQCSEPPQARWVVTVRRSVRRTKTPSSCLLWTR